MADTKKGKVVEAVDTEEGKRFIEQDYPGVKAESKTPMAKYQRWSTFIPLGVMRRMTKEEHLAKWQEFGGCVADFEKEWPSILRDIS